MTFKLYLIPNISYYYGCTGSAVNSISNVPVTSSSIGVFKSSTTTNIEVAKQFSRGTILIIHVPADTKCLDVKSIRPKEQQKKDKENEILLPPCKYEIISKKVVKKQHEPNNMSGTTTILEINVEPLDLLTEFLKVMESPVQEYIDMVMYAQKDDYEEGMLLLKNYIKNRAN